MNNASWYIDIVSVSGSRRRAVQCL